MELMNNLPHIIVIEAGNMEFFVQEYEMKKKVHCLLRITKEDIEVEYKS